jgi:hypothetical protein
MLYWHRLVKASELNSCPVSFVDRLFFVIVDASTRKGNDVIGVH